MELDDFVAFCPFAGRFPLETWLAAATHASHFESLAPEQLLQLAQIMSRVIGRHRARDRSAGLQLHNPHGPL